MHFLLYYVLIISAVNAVLYIADKGQAKAGVYRTPEKYLLGLSVIGGAFGGLLGMYSVRHKTKHVQFIVVNWVFSALWLVALIYCLIQFGW